MIINGASGGGGGGAPKLLWTNANKKVTFGPQTLTLPDMAGHRLFGIQAMNNAEYDLAVTNNHVERLMMIYYVPEGESRPCTMCMHQGFKVVNAILATRGVTIDNANHTMKFENGYYGGQSDASVDNYRAVPEYIFALD